MYAKTAVAVTLALFVNSVVAQSNSSGVDTSGLDIGTKSSWCNAQFESCKSLCVGLEANTCDNPTLTYNCTCANGSAPGLQYYIQTIPTFLCELKHDQCIKANLQNSSAQDECNADEEADCGHLDPNKVVHASPSTTAATTGATNGAANTASPTETSVSSSTSNAAAATMLALGREYGSGLIAAGVAVAMML